MSWEVTKLMLSSIVDFWFSVCLVICGCQYLLQMHLGCSLLVGSGIPRLRFMLQRSFWRDHAAFLLKRCIGVGVSLDPPSRKWLTGTHRRPGALEFPVRGPLCCWRRGWGAGAQQFCSVLFDWQPRSNRASRESWICWIFSKKSCSCRRGEVVKKHSTIFYPAGTFLPSLVPNLWDKDNAHNWNYCIRATIRDGTPCADMMTWFGHDVSWINKRT